MLFNAILQCSFMCWKYIFINSPLLHLYSSGLLLFTAIGNFAISNKRQLPCCTVQYRYCKFWSCYPLIWITLWESYSADFYFLSQKFCFTHLWGFQQLFSVGYQVLHMKEKVQRHIKKAEVWNVYLTLHCFSFFILFFKTFSRLEE